MLAQLITHTGGQDAGGSLIEVERSHAPHAICDERQHVSAHMTRYSVNKHVQNHVVTPIWFVCEIKHDSMWSEKQKISHFSAF